MKRINYKSSAIAAKTESLPNIKFLKGEVIEALIKSLGITKAAFFIRETMSQKTDYIEIKEKLFVSKTAAELNLVMIYPNGK
ncbi:MAG: hypothetical protein Q8P40_00635 [Nitrospirota bacterium]|nr:hypothetical protein [Nitrospirota bacterium]